MKQKLFLCGDIGCGKTTMIRNVLGEQLAFAGGFVTQRVKKDGRLQGFVLSSVSDAVFEKKEAWRCFLSFSEALKQETDVFSDFAVKLLQNSKNYPYVLLDEIGGMELLEDAFWEELIKFVKEDIPCVGVVKNEQAMEALCVRTNLGERYRKRYQEFILLLEMEESVEVCRIDGTDGQEEEKCRCVRCGDRETEEKLRTWKELYLKKECRE